MAARGAEDITDVVTLGETMALMKADTPGPLAHVSSMSLGIGGAESNVAIALSRLGSSVAWIGRVGKDSLGDLVLRELAAEGVQTLAVRDSEAPTGLMVKERRTPDALKVWYYRKGSAGSRLCRDDVPVTRIEQARLLHITGITPALSQSAGDAVRYAMECARDAETIVSFDFNYRSALWGAEEAGSAFRRLAALADVVFAGDSEAELVLGGGNKPVELAHGLCELGPSQAVIKLGAAGCAAVVKGIEYQQEAVPVNAVDTVGAGDAFVAGYLAEVLAGESVPQRLLTAVRTGAFACLVPGDWEGMPRRSELGLLESAEPVSR
ncbi:2-dehydro-3-deoxygluconokinase [Arthrobacter pigmenti]|uniref:2-dehydro-3-deoxygluconokinase n=1 Tax=Arthrobacter pigmenti TaxID=271432 RepID=A0A846RTA1_9MICC|nr:2-dehydro-3-deoxygluconokinase [Arthrobacter pigmenti]